MNVRVGDIIKLENNQFVAVSKLHQLFWCFFSLIYFRAFISLHSDMKTAGDVLICCRVHTHRLTSSSCAAASLMGCATLRRQSWMGERKPGLKPKKTFAWAGNLTSAPSFVLSNSETNLKVRQAVSVTSDLGDVSKLMEFDGICVFSCLCLRFIWDSFLKCPGLMLFKSFFRRSHLRTTKQQAG